MASSRLLYTVNYCLGVHVCSKHVLIKASRTLNMLFIIYLIPKHSNVTLIETVMYNITSLITCVKYVAIGYHQRPLIVVVS